MAVLILGAGRVSGPAFEYFHRQRIPFSVASAVEKELNYVKSKYPSANCCYLQLPEDVAQLRSLTSQHEVVLHLIPCALLYVVAQTCLEVGRPLVSCSYVSEDVQELHEKAVKAGVLLLCECGLDPGIDHMLAVREIHNVKNRGGQVTSFSSWCGGLPAPEFSTNVLKYKFSWHPRGALEICQRKAGYMKNGKVVEVPGKDVLYKARPIDLGLIIPCVKFESFPNDFSSRFLNAYGLLSCQNFARGTIRYEGFSHAMLALVQSGLFSEASLPILQDDASDITWRGLLSYLLTGSFDDSGLDSILLSRLENSQSRLEVLKKLDLLSDKKVERKGTPIDTLCHYLQQLLNFAAGERDMVVMVHELRSEFPKQSNTLQKQEEVTTVSLVEYGDPHGYSAMAKTVGFPAAIAAEMILTGKIQTKGVALPTTEEIYREVLAKLQEVGIAAKVSTSTTEIS